MQGVDGSGVAREFLNALRDERTEVVESHERCGVGLSAREHLTGRCAGAEASVEINDR
jgi:hypothetical protein